MVYDHGEEGGLVLGNKHLEGDGFWNPASNGEISIMPGIKRDQGKLVCRYLFTTIDVDRPWMNFNPDADASL